MKLASSLIALAIVLASSAGGLAADKTTDKPDKTKPTKVVKPRKTAAAHRKVEEAALTGSYIKRDIHRQGMVTDGPNPVVVVNEEMIRNSGAVDLRDLLVRKGLSR